MRGQCLLWNVNLIPWVAASVNAMFPLQISVDKYLCISYSFLRLSHYNVITEAKKKFTIRQTATTKLQRLVIRFWASNFKILTVTARNLNITHISDRWVWDSKKELARILRKYLGWEFNEYLSKNFNPSTKI